MNPSFACSLELGSRWESDMSPFMIPGPWTLRPPVARHAHPVARDSNNDKAGPAERSGGGGGLLRLCGDHPDCRKAQRAPAATPARIGGSRLATAGVGERGAAEHHLGHHDISPASSNSKRFL